MAMPQWRFVESTDDGCAIFQCLTCYETWEARTSPERWVACPYCCMRWNGEHKWDVHKKYENFGGYPRHRSQGRLTPCHFVIEERFVTCTDGQPDVIQERAWKVKFKPTRYYRADHILKVLRDYEKEDRGEDEEDDWLSANLGYSEFRIVVERS